MEKNFLDIVYNNSNDYGILYTFFEGDVNCLSEGELSEEDIDFLSQYTYNVLKNDISRDSADYAVDNKTTLVESIHDPNEKYIALTSYMSYEGTVYTRRNIQDSVYPVHEVEVIRTDYVRSNK